MVRIVGIVLPAPGEIGRCEARRPVVEMQKIGAPQRVAVAAGDVGGGKAKAREADVVVAPVDAEAVDIGRAVAIVEFGAQQNVDGQAVLGRAAPQAAGGNAEGGRQAGDLLHGPDLRQNLAIARDENAHIVVMPQRPRQSGRHFTEAAGLDVIGDLGCDEKNGLSAFDGNGRLDAVPAIRHALPSGKPHRLPVEMSPACSLSGAIPSDPRAIGSRALNSLPRRSVPQKFQKIC